MYYIYVCIHVCVYIYVKFIYILDTILLFFVAVKNLVITKGKKFEQNVLE